MDRDDDREITWEESGVLGLFQTSHLTLNYA